MIQARLSVLPLAMSEVQNSAGPLKGLPPSGTNAISSAAVGSVAGVDPRARHIWIASNQFTRLAVVILNAQNWRFPRPTSPGPHLKTCPVSVPAAIFGPVTAPLAIFLVVTAPFLSALVVTEFFFSLNAAYAPPLSAMNSAKHATI